MKKKKRMRKTRKRKTGRRDKSLASCPIVHREGSIREEGNVERRDDEVKETKANITWTFFWAGKRPRRRKGDRESEMEKRKRHEKTRTHKAR